jgi:hypothetical protein
MAFDLTQPLTGERLEALVRAVVAGDVTDENEALEWKRRLDLKLKPLRAQTARQLVGFANRDPEDAQRWFAGNACPIIGAEPGAVTGMERVDHAVLDDRLRPYTGDRLRWSPSYVEVDGEAVLAIVVDAPRRRDPEYRLERGSADEKGRDLPAGAVFVRKGARTVWAEESDHARLVARAETLRVGPDWNAGLSGDWLGVTVVNPPTAEVTAVTQVGFLLGPADVEPGPASGDPDDDGPPATAGEMIVELASYDPPHRLRPAERLDTRVTPSCVPFYAEPETKFLPFAVDIEGVRHYGRPLDFFRLLIEGGWQPDPDLPDPLTRFGFAYVGPDPEQATVAWLDPDAVAALGRGAGLSDTEA